MTREELKEPCEDAVNRQAVLNTLDNMDKALNEDRTVENYKELLKECYEVLPSVTARQKTGHWIHRTHIGRGTIQMYVCSNCRQEFGYDAETGIEFVDYKYCPNCGADMRGDE